MRGAELLRKELQELKSVKRPQIIEAIATARAHGDLRENAEYHAAREQQAFVEGRIKDIESKLSSAQIIDVSMLQGSGRVTFGATVVLVEEATGEESTYTIVGEDEADIKQRMVSISSPIARAMIGREEGEVITVEAPAGRKDYEVVEVRYEMLNRRVSCSSAFCSIGLDLCVKGPNIVVCRQGCGTYHGYIREGLAVRRPAYGWTVVRRCG